MMKHGYRRGAWRALDPNSCFSERYTDGFHTSNSGDEGSQLNVPSEPFGTTISAVFISQSFDCDGYTHNNLGGM
ncbi:hypothetical protein AB1N83_011915 [Pleurotus pulmonarius]